MANTGEEVIRPSRHGPDEFDERIAGSAIKSAAVQALGNHFESHSA